MQTTKKTSKHYLAATLGLFFILTVIVSFAQNGKEQVKVKIVKIVDGDTTTIEKTMEESNVQDFTKQFQNVKGKNIQVMITVDAANKDKKGKKSENAMHFNFDMDSVTSNVFSKCFMFSDSALCKKFVWHDSLIKGFSKDFDFNFHFDDEDMMKNLDFNINTQEDGKTVIIKKQGGNTIIINEDDDNVSTSESESENGMSKTKTKTIVINDDKAKTKKKVIVSTSVMVIDMEEENSEKSNKRITKEENSFNFYPNPSDGNFIIDLDLNGKDDAIVRITDIAGKEVYNEKFSGFGKTSKTINLRDNKKGTFIVTIKQGKKTSSKKIIIE